MQVAVVGMGNVGSALLHHLSYNQAIDEVHVMSRRVETAMAAIMDVASANPKGAAKMAYAPNRKISQADVIVLTAGVQMKAGQTGKDVLEPNVAIAETILDGGDIKQSAVIIALATPVDYVTVNVHKISKLPHNQVFGFGGDLDRNRLEYILRNNGHEIANAQIVGEHGANVVPLYASETDYEAVAGELRKFLSKITKFAGETRNLATADLLAKLIDTIVTDARRVHYVCGYHTDYQVYLTWPFTIGREGIIKAQSVDLPLRAGEELATLVGNRVGQIKG